MGAPATASPWPILTTPSAGRCGIARAAATKSLTTSSFSRPRRARVASTEKLQCRLVRLISSPRMGEATASGGAVLVTSHHFDELARVADRVDVLHRGRVVDSLTPDGPHRRGRRRPSGQRPRPRCCPVR